MSYSFNIVNKNTYPNHNVLYNLIEIPEGLTGSLYYVSVPSGSREQTVKNFIASSAFKNAEKVKTFSPTATSTSDYGVTDTTNYATFLYYVMGEGETFLGTDTTTIDGVERKCGVATYDFVYQNNVSHASRNPILYNNYVLFDYEKSTGKVRGARGQENVQVTKCKFLSLIKPKVSEAPSPTYTFTFETLDNVNINPTSLTSAGDVIITPKSGYVFDDTNVHIAILNSSGVDTGDTFRGYSVSGDTSKITLTFPQELFDDNYNLKIDFPTVSEVPSPTYTFTFETLDNVTVNPTSLSDAGDVTITPKVGYKFDSTSVHIDAYDTTHKLIGVFSGYSASGDVNSITLSFTKNLFDDDYILKITEPTVSIIKTGVTVPIKKEATHCSISGVSQLTEGVEATFTGVPETGYVIESIIVYADSDVIANTRNNTLSFVPSGLDTNKTYKVVASAVVVTQEPPSPDNVYLLNNIWLLNNEGVKELTKPYFTLNGVELTTIELSKYCEVLARIPFLIVPENEKVFTLNGAISTIKQWYTTKAIQTFDFGSIKVEEKFKNYTAYEPYVMYNLWLPMLGYQNINSEDIVGHTVGIKLIYNVYTGMGCYVVNNENCIIGTYSVKVAEDLPLINRTADGLTQTMMASQLTENMNSFFIEKDYGATDLSSEGAVNGHDINEVSQVKDHSGFLKCEAVDLNGLSTYSIMSEEINKLLLTGIIV